MCDQFNIKYKTTGSESPRNNGLCEWYNKKLTTMLPKIKDDAGWDFDRALSWALWAKNPLIIVHGPSQILGQNGPIV